MSSVQRILPRAGADWQKQHAAPERPDQVNGKKRKRPKALPKPGTGKLVDREA